ncbi:hypothetical protein BCR44DRAFT_74619 [Catenaria anguillulae PL171]|uniref:Uncharacterized protein n=1 Tax=Catenaria anguillulae PL171 TaxID=765915 RepID=A0A1Y2H7M6_9FUNG|nr:hypothetical protein BCR44DRAFT_74619 [Catenaria anguillulae PL171]
MSRVNAAILLLVALLALVSTVTAISDCCRTNTDCRQVNTNVDIICVRDKTIIEVCQVGNALMPKNCRWRKHWFGSMNSPGSAGKECFIKYNCAENLGWYRHDIRREDAWCYTRTNPGWEAAQRWFDATPNC